LDKNNNNFDLIREANILYNCNHENIVKLIGIVCYNNSLLKYLIMEYMNMGDLRSYLIKNRINNNCLIIEQFIKILIQISNGCLYLENNKIVHRDLAARNCLLNKDNNNNLIVKISDLGLARDIYTCDLHKINMNKQQFLPFRWMSPESIFDGEFTIKSDVWSFAILVCEIFNFGNQPYSGMSNNEIKLALKNNKIHELPDNCPNEM
jgi:serine/threonine protein kinase